MAQCKKTRCPLVREPLEACFIVDMDSRTIERAIYYCGGNYLECEIYKQHVERNLTEAPDASK